MLVPSLGHGRCGHVLLIDGLAVKAVHAQSDLAVELQHEAAVYQDIQQLQGTTIPTIHTVGSFLGPSSMCFVMNVVGFSLTSDLIPRYEMPLLFPSAQVALQSLHDLDWLHGDVRLENFALKSSRCIVFMEEVTAEGVVVLDFGFAQRSSDPAKKELEMEELRWAFSIED